MKRFTIFVFLCFFSLSSLFCQEMPTVIPPYLSRFPDTYEARALITKDVVLARLSKVLGFQERIAETSVGKIEMKLEAAPGFAYIAFLRQSGGAFPPVSAGSCYLQRETVKGYLTYSKHFINDDPSCFLKFAPVTDRCKIDLVVYGAVLAQELYSDWSFILQFGRPLTNIVNSTIKTLDWFSLFYEDIPKGPREVFADKILESEGRDASFDRVIAEAAAQTVSQELAAPPYALYSHDRDIRTAAVPYQPFPKSQTGIPLAAVRAAVYFHSAAQTAFRHEASVFVASGPNSQLLLIPRVGPHGVFEILSFDTRTHAIVDMQALLEKGGFEIMNLRKVSLH